LTPFNGRREDVIMNGIISEEEEMEY